MVIYLNGIIYTLDPARPQVEAVACAHGRVVAIGRSHELQALARSHADIVDLQGRTAIPGLIDAHIHLLSLGLALGWVELGGARTLAECVERVAQRARDTEPGRWIMGRGWNQNEWAETRWPARSDLDAVVGDRPVVLNSKDGHLLWVNTAALCAAGMTRDTPNPLGGAIARDEHGEPTGVLKENATHAGYPVRPPPSDDAIDAALIRAMDHALRLGLVGIGNFE